MESQDPDGPYILLVEDSDAERRFLAMLLRRRGYAVVTAEDGLEALDQLQHAPPPCVILLDWLLPRLDGAQFRRRQLQDPALAPIPVVVLTALPERVGDLDGATPVLAKPVTEQRLLDVVRPYCDAPLPERDDAVAAR